MPPTVPAIVPAGPDGELEVVAGVVVLDLVTGDDGALGALVVLGDVAGV